MTELPRVTGPDGTLGPVDASITPRFAGPATFARLQVSEACTSRAASSTPCAARSGIASPN